MAMNNGVMTMRPLDKGLAIEPGKTVKLAPGGYHLMLMDLKNPLKQGDKVPLTLEFEKAGKVALSLDVQGVGAQAPAGGAVGARSFRTRRSRSSRCRKCAAVVIALATLAASSAAALAAICHHAALEPGNARRREDCRRLICTIENKGAAPDSADQRRPAMSPARSKFTRWR